MRNLWKPGFFISFALLIISFAITVNSISSLNATKMALVSTESQLLSSQDKVKSLTTEVQTMRLTLDDTKAQLNSIKTQLSGKDIELGNVNAKLVTTNTQLTSITNQLASTNIQLKSVSDTNTQLLNSYELIRKKINLRFGNSPQDRQSYITPKDVMISQKVQEITNGYSEETGEYWADLERLYRWVVNNIEYSSDSYTPLLSTSMSAEFSWRKDFWRTPAETMKDKSGDCEDMALLLASMMISYNKGNYSVWLISISSRVPELKGHIAVAFPVKGGKLTVVDPAGNYYTGMKQYGSLYSESASTAISNWLAHWATEMPSAIVDGIFSDTTDKEFSNTEEFLVWLSQR